MENAVRLTIKTNNVVVMEWLETQGDKSEAIIKLIMKDIQENGKIVNHAPTSKDKKNYLKLKLLTIMMNGTYMTTKIIKEFALQENIAIDDTLKRACKSALNSLAKEGVIKKIDSKNWGITVSGYSEYNKCK